LAAATEPVVGEPCADLHGWEPAVGMAAGDRDLAHQRRRYGRPGSVTGRSENCAATSPARFYRIET
jgi:hypothetical protein